MKSLAACVFLISSILSLPAQLPRTEALRVCADPDYMPYSNRAGEGFENKIAEAVARALGEPLEYTWGTSRRQGGFSGFLSATLNAKKCDVVMDVPYASREELTTQPYYISSYVFAFKKNKNYDITGMDSPALKGLRIGFETDTPAEDSLKVRGLLDRSVAFRVADDPEESPASMLAAIEDDRIDVLITWEPAIGAFLREHPDLRIVPVPNSRALGSPELYAFAMSMAVREDDQAMKKRLDDVVAKHQEELTSILNHYGVKLYMAQEPDLR